jgi:hypothetical protein
MIRFGFSRPQGILPNQ